MKKSLKLGVKENLYSPKSKHQLFNQTMVGALNNMGNLSDRQQKYIDLSQTQNISS